MDITEEKVIKLFRKEIAEKEGISEEEAGIKINKDVEIALDIINPLMELHKKIGEKAETDKKEAMRTTMMVITHLLIPFDPEIRKMILGHIMSKIDEIWKDIDRGLDKYFKNN